MRVARALLIPAVTAAVVLGGAGVAEARPVLDPPTHTYCGPGFYPWTEYGYCKAIRTLDTGPGITAGTTSVGEALFATFAGLAWLF